MRILIPDFSRRSIHVSSIQADTEFESAMDLEILNDYLWNRANYCREPRQMRYDWKPNLVMTPGRP